MGAAEQARLKEVERRLRELQAAYDEASVIWMQINRHRLKLQTEMQSLFVEKDLLLQGQLLFPGAS